MKKLFFIFILILPLSGALASFLPKTFNAEFEQVHKSSITGKEKKSKGSLAYLYPGHIRLETKYPDDIIFVSNSKKTWLYRAPFIEGEPGELTISSKSNQSLANFFDVLKNGLVSNKLYTVNKKGKDTLIKFNEKKTQELGVTSAVLSFKGKSNFKNIAEVLLTKSDKTQVKIRFEKIQPNVKFNAKHFIFKAPAKTRVTK